MRLSDLFQVFSRRRLTEKPAPINVPESTRNRVLLWCADVFSNRRSLASVVDITGEFWDEIHRTLQMRHGRIQLWNSLGDSSSGAKEAVAFLLTCSGPEFLDFLEYIFRVDCYFRVGLPEDQVVGELSELLRVDDLPFYLTGFVREQVREVVAGPPPFGGREVDVIKTRAYPTVIARDSEVVHSNIVEPVLVLLHHPSLRNANSEYLEALEDFRKGDFGDCLTKCCSSFESVLKVVCEKKAWPYKQADTAIPLIRTVLDHTSLDSYFESPLVIVATLRNRLSKAHGAGSKSRDVPRHFAAYALNSTAAAILLTTSEVGFQ